MPSCFVSFFVTKPVWLASCIMRIGPRQRRASREEARMDATVLEKPVRSEALLDAVNGWRREISSAPGRDTSARRMTGLRRG